MRRFCFILGKNPILSVAEIFNLETTLKAGFNIIDLTSRALIVEAGQNFDPQQWQNLLGGTIKIGEMVDEFKTLKELFKSLTFDYFGAKLLKAGNNKTIFGFSMYGDTLWRYQSDCRTLGLNIKKEMKKKDLKSRFVAAPEGALTSVQVTKNKIIEQGVDIIIISGVHSLYLGRTLAVQDFEEYSSRDYGRPKRDAYSGMLPPKLAKIMINLSQAQTSHTILDPFCGSGTILQEARLMKYKKITGSDLSRKAIDDTQQNLDWLAENCKLSPAEVKLFRSDVKELPQKIPAHSINTIITEPYLGPPIQKSISTIDMLAIIQELETLYLSSFHAFSKILKKEGRVVIAFPLFKTKRGIYSLRILEQLDQSGFQRQNPLPEKVSLFAKVGPTARGSLIYQRPDQTIEREILIFKYHKKTEAA